jgi:hypothetical protein
MIAAWICETPLPAWTAYRGAIAEATLKKMAYRNQITGLHDILTLQKCLLRSATLQNQSGDLL